MIDSENCLVTALFCAFTFPIFYQKKRKENIKNVKSDTDREVHQRASFGAEKWNQ